MADFDTWNYKNLVDLVEALTDENERLEEDVKVLRKAWRELVKERYPAVVPAGSPDRQWLSPAQAQALVRLYGDQK